MILSSKWVRRIGTAFAGVIFAVLFAFTVGVAVAEHCIGRGCQLEAVQWRTPGEGPRLVFTCEATSGVKRAYFWPVPWYRIDFDKARSI